MKQYLKVAAIVIVTIIAVNTIARRVPGIGSTIGRLMQGV